MTSVSILARRDCCDDRIDGVKVFIDGHECGVLESKGRGKWVDVQCGGVIGKNLILNSTIDKTSNKRD